MMSTGRWMFAVVACLLLASSSGARPHRRSMLSQSALPVSKGGWRPVVGSSSLFYGSFGTAPLHASPYKQQYTQYDLYPSSSRPVATRDATKLTSIAQAYKPTTHRTLQSSSSPINNQPINSYHNPFTLQSQGLTHYKFVQNFPMESVVIRNPHNPYAARPIQHKAPLKHYKPFSDQILQQLSNQNIQNMQPVQLGHFPTLKPMNQINDLFNKPLEIFSKPIEKPLTADTEIYKPEVYKVPSDTDTAPQSVSPVQTAQQQSVVSKPASNPYQYSYQNSLLPPSILSSFGLQTVVGRNPVYQSQKSTFLPAHPTRQTIFNSFNFAPNFKATPVFFPSSTPKFQTTANQIQFGSTLNNFTPTEQSKVTTPSKIDPNAGAKTFKPSPQDPFVKNYPNFDYSISTYNPRLQTTTLASNIFDNGFNFVSQQPKPLPVDNSYKQHAVSNHHEKKKHKVPSKPLDSVAAGGNQQPSINSAPEHNSPHGNTYEVTENNEHDIITYSAPPLWSENSDQNQQNPTEESVTKQDSVDSVLSKPSTSTLADVVEDVAIVTEGNKVENSQSYNDEVESQNRRPVGDDFEPIEKQKLKDYYYRVSTPSYHDKKIRRTKKPSEPSSQVKQEVSSVSASPSDALPTLPPNLHFKRPNSTPEPLDKDRIRKRNKIRRRRPPLANNNRNRNESVVSSTDANVVTEAEANQNRRGKPAKQVTTTPPVTTEFTTSALPTVSPTLPTIVKKKIIHRRPASTTPMDKIETTTQAVTNYESSKESSIMKIAGRLQYPRLTPTIYEVKTTEIPDYTHKQDEKDTPTSDIVVNLSESLKTVSEGPKEFSFHRDMKPIDAKEAATTYIKTTTDSTDFTNEITTLRSEATSELTAKIQRPRLKNKYNRPRFSVKDYRNRLSSTTSTTEKSAENNPKVRFPQRRAPSSDNYFNSDVETTTERKKFVPKEPKYKINKTDANDVEKETSTTTARQYSRQRTTTSENTEATTQKISSRIRNGQRRPRPTEEPTDTTSTPSHNKRPLRKKIKDSDIGESVQDISITESTTNSDKNDITSERTRSESAIMKIADKKHHDHNVEHVFEHSKRVSDLTLAASKDYNKPGMFKSVSSNSRRIPNYFTIATDDPILPIEAFFPQLNQKKES